MGDKKQRQVTRFCVVDHSWTVARAVATREAKCKTQDHRHLGWKEINQLWSLGFLEPLRDPKEPRPESEPDYIFDWLVPGQVIQFKRITGLRGLSCKIGGVHAIAVMSKKNWALAMLAQIKMRREPGTRDLLTLEKEVA